MHISIFLPVIRTLTFISSHLISISSLLFSCLSLVISFCSRFWLFFVLLVQGDNMTSRRKSWSLMIWIVSSSRSLHPMFDRFPFPDTFSWHTSQHTFSFDSCFSFSLFILQINEWFYQWIYVCKFLKEHFSILLTFTSTLGRKGYGSYLYWFIPFFSISSPGGRGGSLVWRDSHFTTRSSLDLHDAIFTTRSSLLCSHDSFLPLPSVEISLFSGILFVVTRHRHHYPLSFSLMIIKSISFSHSR